MTAPLNPVDPELTPMVAAMTATVLRHETLGALRENFAGTAGPMFAAIFPEAASLPVTMERRLIERTDAPPVPVLVYRPEAHPGPLPAVVHMHGGGYVLHSAAMMDAPNRRLANALGCVVVSVDYRLAPETPHPGPIEDCYAALQWLHGSADALGVDAARIGVKGESAGGGLAAALALLARDRGGPKLAFQHLVYPMLDDRTGSTVPADPGTGIGWTAEQNRFGWGALLGRPAGGADVSPYAAPARAGDLGGLPPTFLQVGALDLFVGEDIDYARRLQAAGVPVELHVYPGAFHGFDIAPAPRVSIQAREDSLSALRRSLHG